MKVGFVGFRSCGKTTIFNVLTGLKVSTGPHAEESKPHLGTIKVYDPGVKGLEKHLEVARCLSSAL